MRRIVVKIVLLLTLLVGLAVLGRAQDAVVVVLDDVALEDVDRLHTPRIDELADEGAEFRRAYSMTLCSPDRATRMFGVYYGTGAGSVTSVGPNTPDPCWYSIWTLAKGARMNTALVGKWHLGANQSGPPELAYAQYPIDAWRSGRLSNPGDHYTWDRYDDGTYSLSTTHTLIADRDAALEWWAATPSPKFMLVALAAAHGPQQLPPPELASFPYTNTYSANVNAADTVVGQLVDTIGTDGVWWFVTADNGTPGPVAGGEAKGTAYERGVKIPLVVSGPGVVPGPREALVQASVDLMGTLGQALGVDPPPGWEDLDTESYYPALLDPLDPGRAVLYVDGQKTVEPFKRSRAAIGPRWKVLRHRSAPDVLYDLDNDPDEDVPLPITASPWGPALVAVLDLYE